MKDKVCQIMNIMNWISECKDPTWLYFLDLEKAFDRLKWQFLKSVLRRMNFGLGFQQWVNLMPNITFTV